MPSQTESPEHVYHREIRAGERHSLAVVLELLGAAGDVLDLGMGSGAIGRALARQAGAPRIDGVTLSAEEARLARPHYRQVHVADLESADLPALLNGRRYDAIVCADVLEHLRAPERVLRAAHDLLAPNGRLIVSVPNVGYAGLIAELMAGRFEYRTEGLLDQTHVRFFTRQSLLDTLRAHGWTVEHLDTVTLGIEDSEFRPRFEHLPPAAARHLLTLPDAQVYQFVLCARPGRAGDGAIGSSEPPQTTLPEPRFTSEVMLRGPQGYDEARKVRATGQIGALNNRLRFELPPGRPMLGLRLDLADRPGFMHLHALRMLGPDGAVLWQWNGEPDALAALPHHQVMLQRLPLDQRGALALLTGDDPWIEMPNMPLVGSQSRCIAIELEASWPMSADYLQAAHHALRQAGELAAARDETHRLNLRVDALQATLGEQAAHLETRDEQLSALRRQKQELSATAYRLSAERDGAVRHIEMIENSTVFRATRPLVHAKMRLDALFGRTPRTAAAAASAGPAEQPIAAPADQPVDVIVPVYRGLDDTQRCIRSVLAATCRTPWRLIVINDASPEPEVTEWLRQAARDDARIQLLENEVNLGFVGTVNRGMALNAGHDVLLLNSDAEVANDWLDRLRAAAYRDRRVASVTPFSNNATICSYPRFCQDNALPTGWDTARLDQLFAHANAGQAVDVPTGVGFCMYIRRAALAEIGLFDVETFGKGYGEENDFCIRAANAGWRNLHALDAFVHHAGGVSFGAAKSPREREAMETLRRLHPGYEAAVLRHVQADPARLARLRADVARLHDPALPAVLAVLHDRGGGTERHVHELAASLAGRVVFYTLRPASGGRVLLQAAGADEAFQLEFDLPHGLDDLVGVLRALGVRHLHFHHLLGHGDAVLHLPERLQASYDFTAHDFYTLCPQITLTDHTGRYCGELGTGQCTGCLRRNPAPTGETIEAWRSRHAAFLTGARTVLVPSEDAARRLRNLAPAAQVQVVPHTDIEDAQSLPPVAPLRRLSAQAPLKVAVLGALSVIKGADVLEDVAMSARKAGAPVEFHLIGYAYRTLRTQPGSSLSVHGRYDEKDLPKLLDWLQPDVVWFPALWPETYSYTLSACLHLGLPVVVPDLGAFAERVQGRAWSWVRPWNATAAEWLGFFEQARAQHFLTGESPPAPTDALPRTAGDWHYATDYTMGLAPAGGPVGEPPLDDDALTRYMGPALPAPLSARGLKGQTLQALARLRASPLLAPLSRAVPAHWQRRVKNWLSA